MRKISLGFKVLLDRLFDNCMIVINTCSATLGRGND